MTKIEDEYAVATVLGSIDPSRWREVQEAIRKGGPGHSFAPGLDFGRPPEGGDNEAYAIYQEAVDIAERNQKVRQAARNLHENIREAMSHLSKAEFDIYELRDLEAEGFETANTDVEKFLDDAQRMLRAAQGLKYTDETGELK